MSGTLAVVDDTTLTWREGDEERALPVGSADWFMWLEGAASFSYHGPRGQFTARKEQRKGGAYWKAYRKVRGKLRRSYLGKSDELTSDRLTAAAEALAEDIGTGEGSYAMAAEPAETPDLARTPATAGLLGRTAPSAHNRTAAWPAGTVTFLFTDIVDSTRLWEQHPQLMPQVLTRHDTLVHTAVAAHSGVVFKTMGDAVCAAFARAPDALRAAHDAQVALQAEPWTGLGLPPHWQLLVRMAIHSGAAELRDGDYLGPPLNRTARIVAAGHGGQVLLSHATAELVVDVLPPTMSLRDLGSYPLRGLSRPEQIFQLVSPSLPAAFPALIPVPSDTAEHVQQPLLTTKLRPPSSREALIPRPSLSERLRELTAHQLTLVIAPPGFGKTTLLAQALAGKAHSGLRTAWLTLDEADNDPVRFWIYVSTALEERRPGIAAAAISLLRAPQPVPAGTVLAALVNGIVAEPAPLVLVLDDYHVIVDAAIHQALASFIAYLPPNLHLMIASRADVPLPLARLRAQGKVREIRAADLRCSPEEAGALLRAMLGRDLPPESVDALLERTEGWMAGLQLAALSLHDTPDVERRIAAIRGTNRYIWDYLVDEVLDRQTLGVQEFLLHTALLDRMCGELCDAVMRDEDGAEGRDHTIIPHAASLILAQLEAANLFLVPLDSERQWYRYHRLFADVLRARLRQLHPERMVVVHRRAAAWYRRSGMAGEAVQHAIAAADWDTAVAVVEESAEALLMRGEVATLTAWGRALPSDVQRLHPRVGLFCTVAQILVGQLKEALAAMGEIEQAVEAHRAVCGDPAALGGELDTLRALSASGLGDMPRAMALAEKALRELPPGRGFWQLMALTCLSLAYWWRGDLGVISRWLEAQLAEGESTSYDLMSAVTISSLGYTQLLRGQLRLAAQTCWRALTRGEPDGAALPVVAGVTASWLSEIAYEWNDLEAAARFAREGIAHGRRIGSVEQQAFGYSHLAQALQALGDGDGARTAIAEATRLARPLRQVVEGAYVAVKQVRLWLLQGNLADAVAWAEECTPFASDKMYYVRVYELLTIARVTLARGAEAAGQVIELLLPLLSEAEERGQVAHAIETNALLALAYAAAGARHAALEALSRALSPAAPEGYTRLFVDLGASMAELLRLRAARCAPGDPLAPALERLLVAFHGGARADQGEHDGGPPAPDLVLRAAATLVEPLSTRELEVLRLVAAGQSNQAIAETLVIAASTVKMHLKNIYGKLDAHSRTQALAAARAAGLI